MSIKIEGNGNNYRVHFSFDDVRWFRLAKVNSSTEAEAIAFWLAHSIEQAYGQVIHD